MQILRSLVFALIAVLPLDAGAQQGSDFTAIVAVLEKSAVDWNRGDIDTFATSYKKSPDILFIGREISHGYAQMLARYRRVYASREQMGRLTFSQLEVQPLDARFSTVTGRFHLDRAKTAGGNSDGFFLLVMEKTDDGWKIVRDDSTQIDPDGR